jgi:hypothetical protein
MRTPYVLWLILPLLLLVGSVTLLAQTDAGLCPALVEQALGELGDNCDALDRNSACYGFNRVDATFVEAQPEGFFSTPADRTALVTLDTIETAPLDPSQEHWGIAVLNVQANVPNTLPGQGVVFLLMGDVEVTNEVPPEDVVQLGDPVDVTTVVAANLRSRPSTNANVVGSVPAGTSLPADGVSENGQWLRVLFDSGPAWVSREVVEGDASGLPVISRESRTPMQAFTFKTGFGQPNCEQSPPSLLVVQGPENVRVDITANGADIQLGSTLVLWLLPGNRMQLVVIDGSAYVDGLTIPEGFTITTGLNEDGTAPDGEGWSNFGTIYATVPEEWLRWLEFIFDRLPDNLLHYPIILPSEADLAAFIASLNRAQTQGGAIVSGPAAGQVDCPSLVPTSPLGGMAYGRNVFYWDAAQGATSYRVNVYDENGALVASGETNAPNTSLSLDVLSGSGFAFSWEVSALVNGQLACTTARVTMQREAAPPPPEPQVAPTSPPAPVCGNYVCEPGEIYTCYIDCYYS